MQPNQQPPYQPQPEAPSDPYHFIMNPEQPKKAGPQLPKSAAALYIIGVTVVLVVLLIVILSIVRGGGSDAKPFVTVLQKQQEIIRVSQLESGSLQKDNVKNFVSTTQLSISSDQAKLKQYLSTNKIKVNEKQLLLGADAATDIELTNAAATSTLDATMLRVLQDELAEYKTSLAKAYQATTGNTGRALLVELDNNAKLLIAQSKQ